MHVPAFTAESSAYQSLDHYASGQTNVQLRHSITPQDCGFFQRIGCVLGPFSWCAPAGLGGAVPFWNCVDKLSGGNCLDCIGGADPRDRDMGGQPDDYAGVDYDINDGFIGHGTQGLTSGVTVGPPPALGQRDSDITRQLNRIERCACGYHSSVAAPGSWFGHYYGLSILGESS